MQTIYLVELFSIPNTMGMLFSPQPKLLMAIVIMQRNRPSVRHF